MKRTILFGVLGLSLCAVSPAATIRTLAGLTGIRFYELTGGATTFDFGPNSSQMTTELPLELSAGNRDFAGLPNESYDVFYSNADGTFNLNGEYISVVAQYFGSGAGLNIGEIELLFGGASPLSTNFSTGVVSFLSGPGYVAGTENNIGDNNTNTGTQMGQAVETARLRITVDFDEPASSSAVPEPGTWGAMAMGLAGIAAWRRRRSC